MSNPSRRREEEHEDNNEDEEEEVVLPTQSIQLRRSLCYLLSKITEINNTITKKTKKVGGDDCAGVVKDTEEENNALPSKFDDPLNIDSFATTKMKEMLDLFRNEFKRHHHDSHKLDDDDDIAREKRKAFTQDALESTKHLASNRHVACRSFWNNVKKSKAFGCSNMDNNGATMNTFTVQDNDGNHLEFKRRFVHRNIPCLIQGLDKSCFQQVDSLWRVTTHNNSDDDEEREMAVRVSQLHETNNHSINADWFLQNMDQNTKVPVKRNDASAGLDEDGRAQEDASCFMTGCTIHDWISGNDGDDRLPHRTDERKYLKDWHFCQIWETQPLIQEKGAPKSRTEQQQQQLHDTRKNTPLYTIPLHFQRDLLNRFLLKFTDGDYRFVYWGPKGSSTGIHSDVLHSFSWSYNVVGEKLWTFYPPLLDNDPQQESLPYITITQHAGECIFVPAGWRRTVINTQETISINHNWVTAASIDLMWECISTEITAVKQELEAWGIHDSTDESGRESMLLGCIGMNISSFFFLVLTEAVDLLYGLQHQPQDEEDLVWETYFSLFLLQSSLHMLLQTNSNTSGSSSSSSKCLFRLSSRLTATLKSEELANLAERISYCVVDIIESLKVVS